MDMILKTYVPVLLPVATTVVRTGTMVWMFEARENLADRVPRLELGTANRASVLNCSRQNV